MTTSPPPTCDRELLSQWVHTHGRAVRGYLLALVRRDDVADDLLQEVFRRAWEARGRYRESGAARAYLIRIADRLVCDRARQGRREVNVEPADWEQIEPADGEAEPSERLSQSESRARLTEALERISPAQQRVLLLRYYGDLEFAEIAQIVGCPLNTALSHARRGLLALRKVLAEVEQ
jgi:RNA polymerase sigma-70 factor (ECF subfamily)